MPRMLELFSGPDDQGMSGYFRNIGWDVVSIDIEEKYEPTYVMDIRDIDDEFLADLGTFDFVWAGVDCSCFSIMTVSHYWDENGEPNEKNYGEALRLKTVEIIEYLKPTYFVIENPRAMMRTRSFPKHWARYTVAYCQYGALWMKPTDLFGFLPSSWHPKFCHHPKTCHHEKSPRGSQDSGIQKINLTAIERSAYPIAMIKSIGSQVNDAIECGVKSWFI